MALVVALIVVVPTALLNNVDPIQAALTAILAGATAAGLYGWTAKARG